MSRPTIEEIKNSIQYEKNVRERLPQFSAFGDDNWSDCDLKIALLNTALRNPEYNQADLRIEIEEYYGVDDYSELKDSQYDANCLEEWMLSKDTDYYIDVEYWLNNK